MKTILNILYWPVTKLSKIPNDKAWHICLGLLIFLFSYVAAQLNIESFTASLSIAYLFTALIGAGKELIWDKWMKKGTPEWIDFFATISIPSVIMFIFVVIPFIQLMFKI